MLRSLALAFTLLAASAVHAAPASSQSVETLLSLTRADAALEASYATIEAGMRQGLQQSMQGRTLTPEQRRQVDALPAQLSAALRQEVSWAKLKPIYIQVYRETFTQEEIDAMIAFYRTPAGQSSVRKMPLVMQRSSEITQAQFAQVIPRMRTAMQQALSEGARQGAR